MCLVSLFIRNKYSLLVLVFILGAGQVLGQKIKYKDLFYLLRAEKYEEAEPFLKTFLSDEKNLDHPNANLQMGITYQRKAEEADIFQEFESAWMFADSSIYYYQIAKGLIDDREVRRNDEYYENFQKRDMRTGKLSVEAFDIHFFIDETIEKIRDRQSKVVEVNDKLLTVITQYNKSRRYFIDFKANNNDINEMLLRANLKTIGALDHLVDTYDSFTVGFAEMKIKLREIPNSGYSQQIKPQTIDDFIEDGETESHFLDDVIQIWNYAEWAKVTRQVILNDILPLKSNMVNHDHSLEEMKEKALADSAVFTGVLNELKSKWDPAALLKFDKDPLPTKLFSLRYADLEFVDSRMQYREFHNSSDYGHRIELIEQEMVQLSKVDSIIGSIAKLDIDRQIRNYLDFVDTRYGGFLGLDKFLKDSRTESNRYREILDEELEWLRERNSYVLVEGRRYYIDTTRSVDFFDSLDYRNIYTGENFSSGIIRSDETPKGYALEVNPQRETSIFYEFELESIQLSEETQLIGADDGSGQIVYLLFVGDTISMEIEADEIADRFALADTPDSLSVAGSNTSVDQQSDTDTGTIQVTVHQAILCKVYRIDGLAWKVHLNFRNEPVGIRTNDLGEIIIDEVRAGDGQRRRLIINNRDGSVKSD